MEGRQKTRNAPIGRSSQKAAPVGETDCPAGQSGPVQCVPAEQPRRARIPRHARPTSFRTRPRHPDSPPERPCGLGASEHLLRKAFEWFDKHIGEVLKQETGDQGRRPAQLAEDLTDRLFFTVITVTDELNAYKVFETLNARGVRLSATDLLKNYPRPCS